MHICLKYESPTGRSIEESELSWSIALYLYISLERKSIQSIEICQHSTYRMVEDPYKLLDNILSISFQDSIDLAFKVIKILDDFISEEWRYIFEIIIRNNEIQITAAI